MANENKPPNKNTFACRNGDTLQELIARKKDAEKRLETWRVELRSAVKILAPLRESIDITNGEVGNLSCRLNTWWNEFHAAGGKD
jgi:hypothetical protein